MWKIVTIRPAISKPILNLKKKIEDQRNKAAQKKEEIALARSESKIAITGYVSGMHRDRLMHQYNFKYLRWCLEDYQQNIFETDAVCDGIKLTSFNKTYTIKIGSKVKFEISDETVEKFRQKDYLILKNLLASLLDTCK